MSPATHNRPPLSLDRTVALVVAGPPSPESVEYLAAERIHRHSHFSGHEKEVRVAIESDRLVLTGRLPSFYLKQVLQTVVSGLPGVARVDNRVDVVCCDGLSSEPFAAKSVPADRADATKASPAAYNK